MSKKKKSDGRALFEDVLDLINNEPGKVWNYKQVAAALEIQSQQERNLIASLLNDFVTKELIEEVDRGKYKSKQAEKLFDGVVDSTQSGAIYVLSPDLKEDIYVAARFTYGALHGDKVRVRLFGSGKRGGRKEGEVAEVIERGRTQYVGTIHFETRVAFFVPDNKKFPDFLIPKDAIGKAKDGQKVIVKMTDWIDYSDLPQGEVTAVLGEVGDNETEINAIMVEYGLPYHFPKDVERVASLIPTEITKEEIAARRDMRETLTFTIDPFDAKDFDDALSVKKLANGNWEVGVHIADVSHYVKPGTMLDKEAFARATSVYLVDRVVPMLPEVLSNFVCSLRPNEDKLTFSAVFELDEDAQIKNEWFGRTVIHSNRRYSYEEVQEILEGKTGDYETELKLLDKFAKKLRDDRMKNGSISFEKEEVKFQLDEKGNPVGVYLKVMKDSNQLIEDFMLLANRRVAEYATLAKKIGEEKKRQTDLRRPFVYRIHASPDPARVLEFGNFIRNFGYRMNAGSEKSIADSLNKLLKDVHGKPESNLIETLAIRTMAKAVYSTDNIGHYGLGFTYYSHFTSPIRRYPDVMAHRLLQNYLDRDAGKKTAEELPDKNDLEFQCKYSSGREKLAAEAERASIKYKQVQFLQDKIGKVFDGVVSGVTEFGFFVELAGNKCEGMVHVRNLRDDRYLFDQERYCLVGQRSGRKFTLGDKVRVLIKSADLQKKQIDFELEDGGSSSDNRNASGGSSSGRKTFSETSGKDNWDVSGMMGGKKKNDRRKGGDNGSRGGKKR
jgi:ribonuclease R